MMEQPKNLKERLISNDLTWPRRVVIQWLKSFAKHHPDFGYNSDPEKTSMVIVESGANLSKYKESVDRVIVARQNYNHQSIIIDNRVSVDQEMFVHDIVKPKLGYLLIYCESRNNVKAEYIASEIEMILLIHKSDLLEMNVGIGDPSMSDVKQPYSGASFHSMVINVPTIVVGHSSYKVKDPSMLQAIELELGVGDVLNFNVET